MYYIRITFDIILNIMKVVKYNNNALAYTNAVYVNPKSELLCLKRTFVSISKYKYVYLLDKSDEIGINEIGLNKFQRQNLMVSINQVVDVDVILSPNVMLDLIQFDIMLANKSKSIQTFSASHMEDIFKSNFIGHHFDVGQDVIMDVNGTSIICKIMDIECFDEIPRMLDNKTHIHIISSDNMIKLDNPTNTIKLNLNFDFEKLGIGGLDKEFITIFRRVFASRAYPSNIIKQFGIKHVKGMLLYGPPGTGKTLIARKIGEILGITNIKVINGPELLSKWVGSSEENVRKIFEDAVTEYEKLGEESSLHLFIFDEIDAICRRRGMESNHVGDNVVNQLLSCIDGYREINNFLVIGMTNLKELLDPALLRAGRLEHHVEIKLPNADGRYQILKIHTNTAKNNGYIGNDVNLKNIADMAQNYSGAEIEELVKTATSYALERGLQNVGTKIQQDKTKTTITHDDFVKALDEIIPSHGRIQNKQNNFTVYSDSLKKLLWKCYKQIKITSKVGINLLVLSGENGSGKTSIAFELARKSKFPFVRTLSPNQFLEFNEQARVKLINETFISAYRSELSLIIIDDIELILEYTKVNNTLLFSNKVLHTFKTLLKQKPPNNNGLCVIITSTVVNELNDLGLSFERFHSIPLINNNEILPILSLITKDKSISIAEPESIIDSKSATNSESIIDSGSFIKNLFLTKSAITINQLLFNYELFNLRSK